MKSATSFPNSLKSSAGLHRTEGSNPYDSWKLDPHLPLAPDEIKLRVSTLNLDSTSAQQLADQHKYDENDVKIAVFEIVRSRGKMHNPVTGSGGVMCGEIVETGELRKGDLHVRSRVVTLVSNTLVPLYLDRVLSVNLSTHQVQVEGFAILPPFAKYAEIPEGLSDAVALTALDVCGVVPQVERLCTGASRVVILGASGKAGLFALYAATQLIEPGGRILAVTPEGTPAWIQEDTAASVRWLECDARNASLLEERVFAAFDGHHADVVIDCTNVQGIEIGAAASCRSGGTVYFFNMATRFQAAALGAELVSRDIQYVIGYGLLPQADQKAFELLRAEPHLLRKIQRLAISSSGSV